MSRTPDNLRGKTPARPAGAGYSPPAPPPKTEDGQSGMRTGRILWYRRTRIEPREDTMGQRIFQVDAFTDRPFAGNPAGVCILETARDDAWMQQVAREMNISETAFLERRDDAFDLRWFTPTVEVDLCGPRDARERARAVAGRPSRAGRAGPLPTPAAACWRRGARTT